MKKLAVISSLIATALLNAQDRSSDRGARQQKIDVQSYLIDAQVDPRAQTLAATVIMVRFIPLEDTSQVTFEARTAR